MKVDNSLDTPVEGISTSLKACTSNQLIQIIEKLLVKRPEIEEVFIFLHFIRIAVY